MNMAKIIYVDPKKEPHKYGIFQQLKDDGKAIIERTNDENRWWRDVSKQVGRQVSDIKVGGKRAILPPSSNQDHNVGYVLTNRGVIVKEETKGKFRIDFKF